jgi:UPF0755 protein
VPRRQFRIALVIVVATLVVVFAVGAYLVKEALSYPDEAHAGTGGPVEVTIPPRMSFGQIAALLAERDVIDKPTWFKLYAMHRGVTDKVRSGDYVLRDDMSPRQVLDVLLEGVRDVTVSVTIPEGTNMLEVFDIIAEAGIADFAELEALGRDPEFLAEHGIDADTIEGYLFPETYRFKVPTRPEKVLGTLIEQFRIVWDRVRREHEKNLDRMRDKLGWSDQDFLTMASIVEKEAVVDSERPRIAQVFINRLVSPSFKPHRLDTDPTIRYGCTVPTEKSAACKQWIKRYGCDPAEPDCKRWVVPGRLHRAQLDDADNAYNTYQHEGLPPGPIANPGEAALRATVNPDGSKYFFFVSRNDGTHVFSRTRAEHERAVDKFQR